jgi:hypothetical protein
MGRCRRETYIFHESLDCVPFPKAFFYVLIYAVVVYIISIVTQVFQQYLVELIFRISREIDLY